MGVTTFHENIVQNLKPVQGAGAYTDINMSMPHHIRLVKEEYSARKKEFTTCRIKNTAEKEYWAKRKGEGIKK